MIAMKKRNPVIDKAFEEGKKVGYQLGLAHGENIGISKATNYIADRFRNIHEVPGIGPATLERIRKHFGEEYFQ